MSQCTQNGIVIAMVASFADASAQLRLSPNFDFTKQTYQDCSYVHFRDCFQHLVVVLFAFQKGP